MKSIFELYAELELTKEKRFAILNKKNEILNARLSATGEILTTELHEQILNEACLSFGIIL
jgi:hypothetical protein